jgi:hypothetical protein
MSVAEMAAKFALHIGKTLRIHIGFGHIPDFLKLADLKYSAFTVIANLIPQGAAALDSVLYHFSRRSFPAASEKGSVEYHRSIYAAHGHIPVVIRREPPQTRIASSAAGPFA